MENKIFTNIKDINNKKIYVNDTVIIHRKNKIEYGTIINKSHQFSKLFFIKCKDTNQELVLKDNFIHLLKLEKIV